MFSCPAVDRLGVRLASGDGGEIAASQPRQHGILLPVENSVF
jgi:hypothetical protein